MSCLRILLASLAILAPAVEGWAAPPDVAGLVLWLDGSDVNGNGTNPAGGSAVVQWSDKSGLGNHATSTGATQPTYVANAADGQGAIDCGPANNELLSTAVTSNFAMLEGTILMVANAVNDFAHVSLSDGSGDDPLEQELLIYNDSIYHHTAMDTWVAKPHFLAPAGFYIQTAVFGNGPNDLTNRIDGQVSNEPLTPGPMPPSAYIAVDRGVFICDRAGQLFNENFDGQIAEVIVYSRKLTLAEQRSLEAYLSAKYSIVLAGGVPFLGPTGTTLLIGALLFGAARARRHDPAGTS